VKREFAAVAFVSVPCEQFGLASCSAFGSVTPPPQHGGSVMSWVSSERYGSSLLKRSFGGENLLTSLNCNKQNRVGDDQHSTMTDRLRRRRRQQQQQQRQRHSPFLFAWSLLLGFHSSSNVEGFVLRAASNKAPHRSATTATCPNVHVERPYIRRDNAAAVPPRPTTTTRLYSSHGTHRIGDHVLKTTLAGRIWPTLIKISHLARPDKLRRMVRHVQGTMHWQGVAFLALVAYGTIPLTQYLWEKSSGKEGSSNAGRSWSDLKRHQAALVLSGLARVALSAYAVDLVCVALTSIGFAFPSLWNLPRAYGKIAYTMWGLQRFLQFKTAALCRLYRVSPETLQSGKLDVLNRALTVASVGLVSLFLFDWLSIQMGMAFKGLLAFGSVGTLAFTLASQDLVSQFISGIFLTASNKVYAGDDVVFGDGTKGTIVRLGFMDTVLRSGDNSITSVPNSKLASQKVSNLSRVRISQVTQTLRFHYEDADEIPALLDTIKSEIQKACPRLITDGSRPFRVFWTGFKEDHLEGTP
jgi:Mechanosensitive ion channel